MDDEDDSAIPPLEATAAEPASSELGNIVTAVDRSDYTLLELQWNGQRFAAVPALLREGGILVALPEETFTEEELALAAMEGYTGLIGPNVQGSCSLRGSRGAELRSEVNVQIVDLDIELLSNPGVDGALAPCTEASLRELTGFGLGKGRLSWPSAEGVRRLVGLFRSLATPDRSPHFRSSPYLTAESGDDAEPRKSPETVRGPKLGLAKAPTPADPGDRLAALEQQVRDLVDSLANRQSASEGTRVAAKSAVSVPPLFEAEAGRTGLNLDQLTALLEAAGRPPERLRDGHMGEAVPGVGAKVLPIASSAGGARAENPDAPHALPKTGSLPSRPQTVVTLGPDANIANLLSALAQQNNNLLGALSKNRGDWGESDADERSTGVKGYQARQQFQANLRRDPEGVYASVRKRLAEAVELDEATLPAAAMRTFFTSKVPLGSMKGLTYFAFAVAALWEAAEKGDVSAMRAQVALLAVYLEQVAVDGGRHQLGWLLTGLPTPPFQLVQGHSQQIGRAHV